MEHLFCFVVALLLFAGGSLANHAIAGESDEAEHYSPTLGSEYHSTPVLVS